MKIFNIKFFISVLISQFCFGLNLTMHDYDNPSASHILDTHVTGDILIVVGMIGGIEIYDISNPEQLNHLANFNLPNNGGGGGSKPNCVSTYNNYAYFTAKNGVAIVNLENPNNPQYIGYVQNTNNLNLENLDIYENILAVCAHTDGVLFFNLENPENPSLMHILDAENTWAVELIEGSLSSEYPIIAYIGDENNIIIAGLDDTEVVQLNIIETPGSVKDVMIDYVYYSDFDMVIEYLTLYIAIGTEGVYAYDISGYNEGNMENPVFRTSYNTSGLANRLDKFLYNVVVSDWDDVEILNFTSNNEVEKVGFKNTTRRTMAIATKDNYIYSTEWTTVQVFEYGEIEGADVDLNTYELNYPFVETGESYTLPVEITNHGHSELEITDIFTTNNEFTVSEFSNLMPGETQTIDVTYTANAVNASGGLRIWSNDEDEPDLTCETNGNIIGANIGDSAPDFELEIVANGTGNYQLSDHVGEIIVLAFFAPN